MNSTDGRETHFIKKIMVINFLIPFIIFLYTQIFFNIYNPYMPFGFWERIALGSFKNIFSIIFITVCTPCAVLIGYFLNPVKKALKDISLIEKAKRRIFTLPIVVSLVYMCGFLSGPLVAYNVDMGVALNDFKYVFSVAFFSGFYGVIFSILMTDDILFDIKRLYGIHTFSDKDTKIPINLKLIIAIVSVGAFIWSLTQYIAYYYLKKGEQVDTGDLFLNMTINFLIVLSTGSVLIWLIGKNIMDMIKYIRTSVDEIIKGKGDLTRRINIVSFDEMGLLTSDFNRLFLYLGNMIGNISKIAMKLENSKNILSASIDKNKEIFESFIKSIGEIIGGIENDFEQTNKLDEISTMIQESALSITDSVEKQQHAVQYSSSSTEEMGANIRSVTNIAKEANSNIFNLLAEIAQTKKDLNNSIKAINTINSSSANLLDYLKSISDISERVKLLAINASIEAARAGKSGEGFAVVAIEVRKLSESSSNSVKNIETKINEMNAVISTGTELINSTAKTLEVIFKKIEKTAQIIEEITTSMIEQTIGTQTIEKSVTDVLESASKLVNLAQNSKEQSDNLKEISEYFISNSKKIYSLTGEQRDKNQNLIEVNQDLTNAALSINSSFAELEKILSEFKIK